MSSLPDLPYDAWAPTKDTLHLYAQVVGKVRLATTAPRNHWWNVPLYVDARGLTTRVLRHGGTTFRIDFDFVDHALRVVDHRGGEEQVALRDGLSVADFDAGVRAALDSLGVDVAIREQPFGVPATTPFPDDREHASYDAEAVRRFWRALDWVDAVLDEWAGWYAGKTSPVHLFWHSFDLAVSRFSGRRAPAMEADPVTREAYSHEVISCGFWAGDSARPFPAFYSYTAPEPAGVREASLPAGAQWTEQNGAALALLPYDLVREADDPRERLLAFLQSAYDAGATAAGWDRAELESAWCPGPERLAELSPLAR